MAVLNLEGHGSFTLNSEQAQSLLAWLEQNGIAQTINTEGSTYEGKTLLNEGERPPDGVPTKNPSPKVNPDGSGTWDFGTKWM